MIRAHALRSFGHRRPRYRVFLQLLGNLLIRTIDRAERIHLAMLSRAFNGEIKVVRQFNSWLLSKDRWPTAPYLPC